MFPRWVGQCLVKPPQGNAPNVLRPGVSHAATHLAMLIQDVADVRPLVRALGFLPSATPRIVMRFAHLTAVEVQTRLQRTRYPRLALSWR